MACKNERPTGSKQHCFDERELVGLSSLKSNFRNDLSQDVINYLASMFVDHVVTRETIRNQSVDPSGHVRTEVAGG